MYLNQIFMYVWNVHVLHVRQISSKKVVHSCARRFYYSERHNNVKIH